ncbi:transmembrane protein 163a-like [Sycon ciliatum]|uniref:transmembrane protein 163a-like n=1 Tax=Sycon ciliatum TaxID=27933 RepID=UPI0031F719EB
MTVADSAKQKLAQPFGGQDPKKQNYECFSVADENYDVNGAVTLRPHVELWRPYAIALCIVSLLVTLGLAIATFILASGAGNDALFGFGATCVLDFLSTAFVLWRFWPNSKATSNSYELELERVASLRIALLFVVAFLVISAKCMYRLIVGLDPSESYSILIVSFISLALCVALAVAKISLSKRVMSPSLYSDGINSLAGAVIAVGVIVSWYVYKSHPDVWYLSSIIGLLVAVGLLVIGVFSGWRLTKQRPPTGALAY